MSPQEIKHFFQEAKNLGGAEIQEATEKTFVKQHSEEKYYREGGEFLPLSVWEKKGFNAVAIKENSDPSDKMVHNVLGEVHRVAILSTGKGMCHRKC